MPNARDKTLITMKRLFAVSASAAAMACAGGTKEKGYAVVDPMPDPRQPCFDPLQKVIAHAAWVTDTDAGAPAVRVRLEIKQDAPELDFSKGEAWAQYGKIIRQKASAKELVAEIVPEPDAGGVTLRVNGLPCSVPMATSELSVSVDLTKGPKDSTTKLKTDVTIPPY